MKVLFLDFDGVLNSDWAMKEFGHKLCELSPWHVARLNEIVMATGADVVISSAWRCMHSLSELREILGSSGFVGRVRAATPDLHHAAFERGMEIQKWLDDNAEMYDVGRFVILDDNDDMAHLDHALVQTSYELGLQPEHVARCIEILGVSETSPTGVD